MIVNVTRRNLLSGGAGIGLAAVAGPATVMAATGGQTLNLSDPKTRAETYAKIYATTAEAEVHKYWTVHYYAYLHAGGNMVPLNTMLNYNYSRWKPAGDNKFVGTAWEVGVYTDFDGTTILDKTWQNPVTRQEEPIAHFKGGPWPEAIGPDGIAQTARGPDVLQEMAIRVIADIVWLPTAANYNFPIPGSDDGTGKPRMFYWDSYFNYGAKVADVLNPEMASVPFIAALHNLSDWQPRAPIANHPGRSYGRAPGQKLNSADELPELAKVAFDRHVPDIFDVDNWKPPRFG
ncbi:MAG: DUF1838 family protein [Rhodospirillaceae bacterium]|nr:DUF1838 family protein [Rhodospirillaceae bacterium]